MTVPLEVHELVRRFAEHEASYLLPSYNEDALRRDFLDPLLRALGWDVGNAAGLPETAREVLTEPPIRVANQNRYPDYAMRVGPVTSFFLEAKKPSVSLDTNPGPALQLRRYGWNAKLPFCILSDFQEFGIYDTRVAPEAGQRARHARVHYFAYSDLVDNWDWLWERFSRDAVVHGSLDRWAASQRRPRGSTPVDAAFLAQISEWRKTLATDIAKHNPHVGVRELNASVQATLDRIVFLRICEDRGIERRDTLLDATKGHGVYSNLLTLFEAADDRYNSGLFHFRSERGRSTHVDTITPGLEITDSTLRRIIADLYPPISPFDFRVLGAEVLGSVYEQFLGEVIRLTPQRHVKIEEKPEVRNAGGVVYTPESVVRLIVDSTLGTLLNAHTLESAAGKGRSRDAHPLSVVDPACGSGSFLIAVYQKLLDWHLERYAEDAGRWSRGRNPRICSKPGGGWRLTTSERKRILLTHVFGVDIDAQAVEVTKLSLLLKVLEDESAETVNQQLALMNERALPDLDNNVKCGNALIGFDFPLTLDDETSVRTNVFDWASAFPTVFQGENPGFDVVLGNPPYVLLQDEFRDDDQLAYFRSTYRVASFKVDTYHLFIERSVNLARAGGLVSLITPTNYMTNNHLAALREFLLTKTRLEEIDVLDGSVFPRRSVDCAVLVARCGEPTESTFQQVRLVPGPNQTLVETSRSHLSAQAIRLAPQMLFTGQAGGNLSQIWAVMRSCGTPLGELARVNFGKQLRNRSHFPTDLLSGNSEETDPHPGYRRCYTGGDVQRWSVTWNGLECTTDREAQMGGCWDDAAQNARNKLLCRQVGQYPDFALDEAGYQCLNTMFMITPKIDIDPWYLLGVLNSTAIRGLWVDQYWDQRRTFPKIKGSFLKLLPIPTPGLESVANLARQLVSLADRQARAQLATDVDRLVRERLALEGRLDAEVADLFGLAGDDLNEVRTFLQEASNHPSRAS